MLRIQILPNPPRAVDHAVMKVEERIPGAGEEIAAWITGDPEVACGVHADVVVGEVALHGCLEGVDVFCAGEEVVDDCFVGAAGGGVLG